MMTDVLREDLIRQGANPDFRQAWEELLSHDERREVKRAVRQARAVARTDLAPYALGLAAKTRRQDRWFYLLTPAYFALSVSWLWAVCYAPVGPSPFCWIAWPIAIAWVTVVPWRLVTRHRKTKRSLELNEELYLTR